MQLSKEKKGLFDLKISRRVFLPCFLVMILNIFLLIYMKYVGNEKTKLYDISDGWTVQYNGEKISDDKDTSLIDVDLGKITDYNDVIVMEKKINEDEIKEKKIVQPAMLLTVRHSYVKIWVDDKKKIFDGIEDDMFNVSLPKNYFGKKIKIELTITREKAFTDLEKIYLLDESNFAANMIRRNVLDITLSAFMFIFGFVCIILVLGIRKYNLFLTRILITGLFELCLCGWFFSNNESFSIFIVYPEFRIALEYYTLYYAVPILAILITTFINDKKNLRVMKISDFIISITAFVSTIITIIFKEKIATYLTIIEIMGVLLIVYAGYSLYKEYSEKSDAEKILLWSFAELGFAIVFETVYYNYCYFIGKKYNTSIVIEYGIVIFILVMIYAYFAFAKEFIDSAIEKTNLKSKAYQDILTGLYNRARVMEEIDSMNKNKVSDYMIINFDLNDLKKINDSYGHIAGDKYICLFASLLKTNLGDYFEVIGRTGGDEFIAISHYSLKNEKIERIVERISEMVKKQCKQFGLKNATFAYGYVISNKKNATDILTAYEQADKKMYECKQKQKRVLQEI